METESGARPQAPYQPSFGFQGRRANRLELEDRAVHDWYRFNLAFPAHLVRTYLAEFGVGPGKTVLDPFCGTGTTLVEARKLGCNVIGFEPNPIADLAATVKTNWDVEPSALLNAAEACAKRANNPACLVPPLRTLTAEADALLLKNSIGAKPLHRALVLQEAIEAETQGAIRQAAKLALASTLVHSASNLHFGPEVGVRGRKLDADVVGDWMDRMRLIAMDLSIVCEALGKTSGFERMYHRVTRLYFGGMTRQLSALRCALKPGAQLGYVVGDQASYLQVMIHTGEILAELAETLGYEVIRIDLFRERFATATKMQMREEVVVLRWPGLLA